MTQRKRNGPGSAGITRRQVIKLGAAIGPAILTNGWVQPAQAQQAYPTRPIDIIIGFDPGGSTDLTTRIAAAYLRKKWNVSVNVINKPGGNTVPAVQDVYKAVPDGHTLLGDPPGSSSMLGIVVRDLPFKVADRTFINMIGTTTMCAFVPPDSRLKSLKDVADDLKKAPEQFTWTSGGGAATSDQAMRQFAKAVGVDILKTKPIVTRGSVANAVMAAGGNVKLGIATVSSCLSPIAAGLIRPLCVVSEKRWLELPEVPTAIELGYPTVLTLSWTGTSGPPNMPAHIVEKWNAAVQEMTRDPEIVAQLKKIGSIPFYMNARDFRAYVTKEADEMRQLFA